MPLIPLNDSSESLVKHQDNNDLIFSLPTPVTLGNVSISPERQNWISCNLIELRQPEIAYILPKVTIK